MNYSKTREFHHFSFRDVPQLHGAPRRCAAGRLLLPRYRRLNRLLVLAEPKGSEDSRYLDPLGDFGFKHVFGKEANKDLLIDFLNSLFGGNKAIGDLWFGSTVRVEEREAVRTVIYDLLCVADGGECFLIEMQRTPQDFFTNRAFHYLSRLVSQQLPAGKAGDSFNLKEVHLIALLDFRHWNDPALMRHPVSRYMRGADLSWIDTGEPFAGIEIRFIQLPTFDKTVRELKTRLDHWLYALRHPDRIGGLPVFLNDPVFGKLLRVIEITNLNKEDLRMYTLTIDADRDWRNAVSFAKRQAREEGLAEGLAEGIAEGLAKGLAKGETLGIKSKEIVVVQALIRETGFNDSRIAALASVKESFVKKIRAKLSR